MTVLISGVNYLISDKSSKFVLGTIAGVFSSFNNCSSRYLTLFIYHGVSQFYFDILQDLLYQ